MVDESGTALVARFGGVDPIFTPAGMRAYADDLIARMVNPYVRDTVARVGRDPARKLGWEDRLVGAMRLAMSAGMTPRRYAVGVAAALALAGSRAGARAAAYLIELWGTARPFPGRTARVLGHIIPACQWLATWERHSYPDLV
jgi:hypothetical protein